MASHLNSTVQICLLIHAIQSLNMNIEYLPTELLAEVVGEYLPRTLSCSEFLALRLINKSFNNIILHAFVDLDIGTTHYPLKVPRVANNQGFAFRYWQSHFRKAWTLPDGKDEADLVEKELHDGVIRQSERSHEVLVRFAVTSAVKQLITKQGLKVDTVPLDRLHTTVQSPEDMSQTDKVLYMLSYASSFIHGSYWTREMLTNVNVEDDYSYLAIMPYDTFKATYYTDFWMLCAAVFLNDLQQVKALLEPLKLTTPRNALWRHRVSVMYRKFVTSNVPTKYLSELPKQASWEEQRWVKMVSSALVIAASIGHASITSYLMRLEPYLARNAFRTITHRTSAVSAMGQAIVFEQRQVFKILLEHKWPLVTSTGFARINYFAALRVAMETPQNFIDGQSIIEALLGMSDAWRCGPVIEMMLQAAVKQNNIMLARTILDRTSALPSRLVNYSSVRLDEPQLKGKTRPFALGTAALLGHTEFVSYLLQQRGAFDQASVEARDSAIHAITCRTTDFTERHYEILKELLQHTDDLCLESAMVRAAYSLDANIVDLIAQRVDITTKTRLEWTSIERWTCDSSKTVPTKEHTDDDQMTLGELALAAALSGRRVETARLLTEKYGVALRRRSVVKATFADRYGWEEDNVADDFEELQPFGAANGLDVTLENAEDPAHSCYHVNIMKYQPQQLGKELKVFEIEKFTALRLDSHPCVSCKL